MKRPKKRPDPTKGFVTVLVGAQDDANVGAVARALKSCGLPRLRLVGGRKLGPRALRTAVHAEEVLRRARKSATLEKAVADAGWIVGFTSRRRRFGPPLETFDRRAAAALRQRARRGIVALLFGRESAGLTDAEVSRCSQLFRLSASPERPVYNLAQAVLLAAHALAFGEERLTRVVPASAAVAALVHGLAVEWEEVLFALGYPPARRPHDRTSRILARLRANLERACVEPNDIAMWRGLLARIAPG